MSMLRRNGRKNRKFDAPLGVPAANPSPENWEWVFLAVQDEFPHWEKNEPQYSCGDTNEHLQQQ